MLVLGVLAAGLFAFAPAPGLGGAGAGLLPGQVDGAWLLVHEAFGLGIGPGGPVPLADAVASPAVVSAFLLYLAFSAALWGGILDRLARQRRVGTGPFWAACGVHGVRFVRLYLIVIPVYTAVFRWLFPLLLAAAARLVDGSDGMLVLGVASVGLVPLLAGVGVIVEFARVRIVVEDRHSAIGAVAAAARFIRRRPGRVTLLYTINLAAVWVLVAAWSSVQADPSTVAGWLAAVVWLVLRIAARLASAGAAIAFFQSELAHAGYAAAPIPMWPDSPTVEGLRNLRI
ncbi:MAG TPA: hypothetical protein VMM93_09410 [Vicinamibacterales bacterium]|nr:hypothetical protein [Vicinamibacterales bacterium]